MLRIAAPLNSDQGYGIFSAACIRAMITDGYKIELIPLMSQFVPSDLRKHLAKRQELIDIDITFCVPHLFTHKTRMLFTMWETENIPASAGLSAAEVVVVPCDFNVKTFSKALTKSQRIEKCHLGVDGSYSIPNSSAFEFVSVSADHGIPQRKQAQAIVNAFVKAFPQQNDVALTLKQNADCAPIRCFDSRVTIIKQALPADDMRLLFKRATIGVQASCAEGWGLPHNEFIANGRPVISPICSGQSEFLTNDCCYAVKTKKGVYEKNSVGFSGSARFVDEDDLARQMLYAYESPLTLTKKSIAAYERAQLFTKRAMTNRWLQIVDKYL